MMRHAPLAVTTAILVSLAGCGGGSSPGSPSGGGGGPVLPGEAATITVTSTGVTPREVTVPVGSRVNFVNQGNVNVEMASDPHPIHTDCPPINQVGGLRPGQTGQTGALNVARRCGFHDHGRSEDARFMGTIIIQ